MANRKINYLKCPMCGGSRHYFEVDSTTSCGGLVFEDIFCAKKDCPFGVKGFGYTPDEYGKVSKAQREKWRKTYWNAGVASVQFKNRGDIGLTAGIKTKTPGWYSNVSIDKEMKMLKEHSKKSDRNYKRAMKAFKDGSEES